MLALIFLFLQAFAGSQLSAKVDLSAPYRVVDAREKLYFHHGKFMLTLKVDDARLTLQRFDVETMKLVSSEQFTEPKSTEPDAYSSVVKELGGKFYLFFSSWDGDNERVFARPIDPLTGTFTGESKLLFQVDGKVTGAVYGGGFYNFGIKDKFQYEISAGGQNLLVKYRKKPTERNDSKSFDTLGLAVFGAQLEQAWHKEVRMPHTEKRMDLWDHTVDGAGNVYILAKVRETDTDEDRKDDGDEEVPNYHGEIFTITPASDQLAVSRMEVGEKFIHSAALHNGPGNTIVVAGLYQSPNARGIDGFFTFVLSASGKTGEPKYHEMPAELLKQFASGRERRQAEKEEKGGKEAGLRNLELRRMILHDDGATLIAEQHYWRYHYNTRGGYYTFHYDDMVVARIGKKGEIRWMRRLPKSQVGTQGQGGMSLAYFGSDTHHYVVFLDHVENMQLAPDKQPETHKDGAGGFLTAFRVADADGEVSKVSILDTRDTQGIELFQLTVGRIEEVAPTTFVMEAYKKKKEDILVRVDLGG